MNNKALLLLCLMMTGCTTYQSAQRLSDKEAALLRTAGLKTLVVAVTSSEETESWQCSHLIDRAISSLKNAALFREIDRAEKLHYPPNIMIRVHPPPRTSHCATPEGIFVICTLGLIPVPKRIDKSLNFDVTDMAGQNAVPIQFESRELVWWGSLISLLAISPNWTLLEPDAARYSDRLAYAIAQKAAEIKNLKQE